MTYVTEEKICHMEKLSISGDISIRCDTEQVTCHFEPYLFPSFETCGMYRPTINSSY